MLRIFRHYIPKSLIVLALIEWLLLVLCSEAAFQLRMYAADLDPGPFLGHAAEVMAFVLVVYFSMVALGAYDAEALRDLKITVLRLAVALSASLILLSLLVFLVPDVALWRSVIVLAMLLAYVAIIVSRLIFRRVIDLERLKRNVLVLGAGPQAKKLVDLAVGTEGFGFRIVACVALPGETRSVPDAICRADINSLEEYCAENDVQEIVLAAEERRGNLPLQDLLACKRGGCRVSTNIAFVEKAHGYVDIDTLQPSWLIFSDDFTPGSRLDVFSKWAFDVGISTIFLILTLPILLGAAAAIKLTSRGPVFYRQERVGRGGKVFKVIKFRSMRTDAESDGVPKWASENDPRITAVGRFIRATRIDEIPQIFNVLMGDMSFVGPRPERPFFVDTLVGQINFYNERHIVKPGITGWAQLNYPYGASVEDSKRKLEYDLYYIKNFSFFLDFLILLQTARVVFWPQGVR